MKKRFESNKVLQNALNLNSTISPFVKGNSAIIFLVFTIAVISLYGWLSNNLGLASFSKNFKPNSPIIATSFIGLVLLFHMVKYIKKIRLLKTLTYFLTIGLALFYILNLLGYFFNSFQTIEYSFLRESSGLGNDLTSRISPISSILLVLICFSIISLILSDSDTIKYIGGGLSLFVFCVSFILLIGYLYGAPFLYGSKIIPVDSPAAICFILFSLILIRSYGFKFATFNLLKQNKVAYQLLKSFLPIIVFIVILEGYLNIKFSANDINPPLRSALILLLAVSVTIAFIMRKSINIGSQILKAERDLLLSERNLINRNKELMGIYSLGLLTEKYKELDDICIEFVNIIVPESFEFRKNIFVSLEITGNKYCNNVDFNLSSAEIYLSAPINLFDNKTGELIVAYPDKMPAIDFYEQQLINTYAERLSKIAERIFTLKLLEDSEKQLLQLNSDKDIFISILSHDLKNPFNNILSLSEILTKEIHTLDKNGIEEISGTIYSSTLSAYNLMESILLWSRIQKGRIPFNPQVLELKDIYEDIFEIYNSIAKAKGININCFTAGSIKVLADSDMLKSVLRNLVSNAIKFTKSGGIVNINTYEDSENVTISVSDNGVGISPDDLIKLFEISEIYSTNGTNEESGSGFGLLLCKEFTEKNGGKIRVQSVVDEGSIFILTFPIFKDIQNETIFER